jgi:hypothetical protein
MATRFYLPSSGSPPLAALAKDAAWELETGLVRRPCYTEKQNTALATDTRTWAAGTTQQWCWFQFQSIQLTDAHNWTTSDTVSMVLGKLAETSTGGDTHLNYCIRVVSADGTVIRGIIGALQATPGSEFLLIAAAATKIFDAATTGATNFSSQIGDRIIIEIGVHGITPNLEAIQFRVGDPTAVASFALTVGLTTDLVSWVQLSRTVSTAAIIEAATSGESSSSILITAGAIVEAGTGTGTESAIFTGVSAIIEALTGIDDPTAIYTGLAGIVESLSAIDDPAAGLLLTSAITEVLSGIEDSDSVLILPVQITESVSINEESSSINIGLSAIIESRDCAESSEGVILKSVSIIEELNCIDSPDSIMSAIAEITETEICSDSLAAVITILSDIIEELSITDILSGLSLLNSIITESLTAVEVSDNEIGGGEQTYPVSISEPATVTDNNSVVLNALSDITESLSAIDIYASGADIILAEITEVLSAKDLCNFIIIFTELQIRIKVDIKEVSLKDKIKDIILKGKVGGNIILKENIN